MNNPLNEAHPPFTAVGRNLVNSNGVPVATATNASTAEALATLANAGVAAVVAVVGSPDDGATPPRFPDVFTTLPEPGSDPMGSTLVNRVWATMTRAGIELSDRAAFAAEAAASDVGEVATVCRRWVTVQ